MGWFSKLFSGNEPQVEVNAEVTKPQCSAAEYCEQGEKALGLGKFVEAMEFFQAAIETDYRYEKAYFLLATAYEKQGKVDKAKATLFGLLAIDPNNAEALSLLKKIASKTFDINNVDRRDAEQESPMMVFQQDTNEIKPVSSTKNCIINIKGVLVEMVYVEGGSFFCGAQCENRYQPNYDPEASIRERVSNESVQDYYIGKYLVTQGLWQAVMGDNPSSNKKGGKYPIDGVSSSEIFEFIKRINVITGCDFRLPTDVEWEYAARGGKNCQGFKYPGSDVLEEVAWKDVCIHEIGLKKPNELGIYDMLGNVCELCRSELLYTNNRLMLRGGGGAQMLDWYRYELDRRRSLEYIDLCKLTAWTYAFLVKGERFVGFRLAMDKRS